MTTFSFVPQLFFPDCMISDSADVSKGMTSSELIQVKQEFTELRAELDVTSESHCFSLDEEACFQVTVRV